MVTKAKKLRQHLIGRDFRRFVLLVSQQRVHKYISKTTNVAISQAAGILARIPRASRYNSFSGLNLSSTVWKVMFICGTELNNLDHSEGIYGSLPCVCVLTKLIVLV